MPEVRKLNLRLPQELHAALLDLAVHECSSANAVTVAALRNWIEFRNRRRSGVAIPRRPLVSTTVALPKVGANQPCPCGSGQKYKRCHGKVGGEA